MKNPEVDAFTDEKSKVFTVKFKLYELAQKIIQWRWQEFFLLTVATILITVVFLQIFFGSENFSIKTDLRQNLQSRP